jgi:hypothetical protein
MLLQDMSKLAPRISPSNPLGIRNKDFDMERALEEQKNSDQIDERREKEQEMGFSLTCQRSQL